MSDSIFMVKPSLLTVTVGRTSPYINCTNVYIGALSTQKRTYAFTYDVICQMNQCPDEADFSSVFLDLDFLYFILRMFKYVA